MLIFRAKFTFLDDLKTGGEEGRAPSFKAGVIVKAERLDIAWADKPENYFGVMLGLQRFKKDSQSILNDAITDVRNWKAVKNIVAFTC